MTITGSKISPAGFSACLKCGSLFFFCLLSCLSCKKTTRAEAETDSERIENRGHLYEYGICVDSLDVTGYTIKSGDSPSAIFTRLGFPATVTESLCSASARVFDPKKLRAGMTYTTLSARDSLAAVRYIIFAETVTDFAIIDLTGDSIEAYEYRKEIRFERRYMEGVITSSLWNTIKNNGADPLLALKISDILAWQVDFFDVKAGDAFRVIYDAAFVDDTAELRVSSVEGLVFVHRGKEFTAIPFTQDGVRTCFDVEGNSLRGTFLKAPLDFFRITSRFTNARFHPVLKRYRAHHGVDYAAPTGTPVKTIGDGTVIAKGFDKKGGGNFVKIKHNSVYTTTYMHLSRFGKGIQPGAHVKQGAVIGYVGSTGLSTGPHLDFRVYKNGQPTDPLKMESPPGEPVKAALRDSFNAVKRTLLAEMDSMHAILAGNRPPVYEAEP
jgi:murein DD-endopeptidase MepM/ murein hydrolase activator NlpD